MPSPKMSNVITFLSSLINDLGAVARAILRNRSARLPLLGLLTVLSLYTLSAAMIDSGTPSQDASSIAVAESESTSAKDGFFSYADGRVENTIEPAAGTAQAAPLDPEPSGQSTATLLYRVPDNKPLPKELMVPVPDAKPGSGPSPLESIKKALTTTQERRERRDHTSSKPQPTHRLTVSKGDTLGSLMKEADIPVQQTARAIEAMKEDFSPRDLQIGQEMYVYTKANREEGHNDLLGFKIVLSPIRSLQVGRSSPDIPFKARIAEKPLTRHVLAHRATISTSLSQDAQAAGIPFSVIRDVISIYSWDIDFQRDIHPGDTIEVMYELFATEDGSYTRGGNVLYAGMVIRGTDIKTYRFETNKGDIDYFKPDGISVRRTLMKTPVDGARLSSGYGMRRHPILGYNKMHKGLDFAASTGTPVFAAGDGVIEEAGWKGSYGKYVRIRHRHGLHTAYAHLSRINVKKGQRVKQKQVIGRVGNTGRSTGPHLHYEVLVNRKQVNPRRLDLPTGIELTGNDRSRFKDHRNAMIRQLKTARALGKSMTGIEVAER